MINRFKSKVAILRTDAHMREVSRNALLSFTLKVAASAMAFAFNVLAARLLGADGVGIYFLALSVTTISSIVGRIGLDNVLLRFIATRAAHEDWAGVKAVYAMGIRMALTASGVITIIVFIAAPWVAISLFKKPELAEPLRWMSLSILPFTLINLQAESLKGLKHIRDAMLVQGVGVPLVSLILIYPLTQIAGLIGLVWSYTCAMLVMAILGAWSWHRAISEHDKISKTLQTIPFLQLLESCKPLFITSLINRALMPWMPIFIVGIWVTGNEIGIFGAAQRVSMLVSFVLVAINSVVGQKFAELYAKGDIAALGTTARRSALLIIILSSPVFLILFLGAGEVMKLYGKEFEGGAIVLVILAVGQFVNMLTGAVGNLLIMSGNEKVFNKINIFALLLQLTLLILLTPSFGTVGAAVATTATVTLINIVASIWVFKLLGIVVIPLISWSPKK
jgi:O-antigen/teichoic acid export membrane protein